MHDKLWLVKYARKTMQFCIKKTNIKKINLEYKKKAPGGFELVICGSQTWKLKLYSTKTIDT